MGNSQACPVCGNPVYSPLIMLLMLDGSVWGVVCEDCRRKYHYDKPILSWEECAEGEA